LYCHLATNSVVTCQILVFTSERYLELKLWRKTKQTSYIQ